MLSMKTCEEHRSGFLFHVSRFELDKGPHPCLYLGNCSRPADRGIPRSKLMIPKEFIDYKYRSEKYTASMATDGLPGGKVETAGEFVASLGGDKALPVIENTDLRKLVNVPFTELMVREADQVDAMEPFLSAHADSVKEVTWSSNLNISASDTYVITLATLQQTFAEE